MELHISLIRRMVRCAARCGAARPALRNRLISARHGICDGSFNDCYPKGRNNRVLEINQIREYNSEQNIFEEKEISRVWNSF